MWKVPWFDYKHSGVFSPSPPAHLPPRFHSSWMWNPQSSLTLKILTSTLYSVLVEPCIERCCFTAREHFVTRAKESQAPFPPQLQSHCDMSAPQPPCFSKQGITLLKTRYLQIQFITIHLFQSPVLWSFARLLFKWASVGLSAVVALHKEELDTHTHPLHQDSSLRKRHPGQHLAGTESFLPHPNRTWERRVTAIPSSSATACFSNRAFRKWHFKLLLLFQSTGGMWI